MSNSHNQPAVPRFRRMLDQVRSGVRAPSFAGSGIDYYKVPEDGANHRFRILPGTYGGAVGEDPARNWYVECFQHWYPDPKSSRGYNTSSYCNASQLLGGTNASTERCPFCEKWESLKEEERNLTAQIQEGGSAAELGQIKDRLKRIKDELRATSFRTVYAVNVLDRGDNDKPKVFMMPKTAFDQLIGQYTNCCDELGEALVNDLANNPEMKQFADRLAADPDGPVNEELYAFADAFDATHGYDVQISRRTENKQTRYTTSISRKKQPALPDVEEIRKVMSTKVDLEAMVRREMSTVTVDDMEGGLSEAIGRAGSQQFGARTAMDPDTASFGGRRRDDAPRQDDRREDRRPARDEEPAAWRKGFPAAGDDRRPAREEEPSRPWGGRSGDSSSRPWGGDSGRGRAATDDDIDYGGGDGRRGADAGFEDEGGGGDGDHPVDPADADFVTPAKPPAGRSAPAPGSARSRARAFDL